MDALNYHLKKIPPVTRYLVLGTLGVTGSSLLLLVQPYRYVFLWPKILQLQVWRVVTSFLLGGQGIPFLFDLYFLYRHSRDLEESHFKSQTSDVVYAYSIVGVTIMALSQPFGFVVFFKPFIMSLIHMWAQANASAQVSLFGFITIPAVWFPFAIVGMDVLNAGPTGAIPSIIGIIAGHIYWYASEIYPRTHGGRKPPGLNTPAFVKRYLGNGPNAPAGSGTGITAGSYRVGGGTAYAPVRPRQATSTTTQTAAPAPQTTTSGYRWGSGQRLGT